MCSIVILALLALCLRSNAFPSSSGGSSPIVYGLIKSDPQCYGLNITSPLDSYPPTHDYIVGMDTVRIVWKITSGSYVPSKIRSIELRFYGEGEVVETVWTWRSSAYGVVTYTSLPPYATSTRTWTTWESEMTTTIVEQETWTQEWSSWTPASSSTYSWSDEKNGQDGPEPTNFVKRNYGSESNNEETPRYEDDRWTTNGTENNSWSKNYEHNSWNSTIEKGRWNTTTGRWNTTMTEPGRWNTTTTTESRSWNATTTTSSGSWNNSTGGWDDSDKIPFIALDYPLTYKTEWPTASGEYYFQLNTVNENGVECWYTSSIIQIDLDM
ncbi:hypothetical protein BJ742DRAFT_742978 [Cladochytrium replicatum]|nr:hypothetical protein BJ742DRAFT_742978 [Cladochytrium replicatum]